MLGETAKSGSSRENVPPSRGGDEDPGNKHFLHLFVQSTDQISPTMMEEAVRKMTEEGGGRWWDKEEGGGEEGEEKDGDGGVRRKIEEKMRVRRRWRG